MEMKFAQVVNKGMQRDYSMNTASQEFAYENKNIRITTTGDESFLAVSNEKSTKRVLIKLPEKKFNSIHLDSTGWFYFDYPTASDVEIIIYYITSDEQIKQLKTIVFQGNVTAINSFNFGLELNQNHISKIEIVDYCKNDYKYYYLDTFEYPSSDKIVVDSIEGIILGDATIENNLILFVKGEDKDFILKGIFNEDTIEFLTVYDGNLNFQYESPIECTTVYESEDVQKVYWVDGINQPRLINICKLGQNDFKNNLDFVPKIDSSIKVSIEKQYEGRGVFPSGVIQYYITYYNKFGQESNAVHITPLYNISPSDRGGTEEETQTCSFKIKIENVDTHYEYIRIYSSIRTSLNTTSVVSIVGDIEINKENPSQYYEIIDDNYGNINVAPSDILFLGGNTISASTIEQKDNTLFLGNISSIVNNDDYTNLKKVLEDNRESGIDGLSFVSRPIEDKEATNKDYGYAPNMDNSSKDRGFKYLEWYRFGLQFQSDTGEWGNTLWLNDKQNPLKPNIIEYDENEDILIQEMYDKADNFHSLAAVKFKPTDEIKNIISNYNSKYYRLVMAEHNDLSRTIKTQGVVMPTVFNLKQRYDNTVFGAPVWSVGMLNNKEHYQNIDSNNFYIENEQCYFITNPQQELDAAIYSTHQDYDAITNPTPETAALSFQILPSASTTLKASEGLGNDYFLDRINVEVEILRIAPIADRQRYKKIVGFDYWIDYEFDMDYHFKSKDNHGTDVIQDIFTVRITPVAKNYDDDSTITLPTYFVKHFRLGGKRKKTYGELFSDIASKTWQDYKNFCDNPPFESLGNSFPDLQVWPIDFASNTDHIISEVELPSVDDFHNEAGQKRFHKETFTLWRNSNQTKDTALVEKHSNQYFIDANLCNMWSPNINNLNKNNLNFRIVGGLRVENTQSDYDIILQNNTFGGTSYSQYENTFNRYVYKNNNVGITSFPLWPSVSTTELYWVYKWNQNTIGKATKDDAVIAFTLKNKTFANLWKTTTDFVELSEHIDYGNTPYDVCLDSPLYIQNSIYENKYQNVIFPKTSRRVLLKAKEGGLTTSTDFAVINSLIENNWNVLSSTKDTYDTINIKYSSTPHLVFNLGTLGGFVNVLPSYQMEYNRKLYPSNISMVSGNVDINNNVQYPISKTRARYLIENTTLRNSLIKKLNSKVNFILKKDTTTESINACKITEIDGKAVNISFYSNLKYDFKNVLDVEKNEIISILDVLATVQSVENIDVEDGYFVLNVEIIPVFIGTELFESPDKTIVHCNDRGTQVEEFNYDNYEEKSKITSPTWIYNKDKKIHTYKLFLGEFYANYDPSTFMGGSTENALELNTFIPISDPTPIGETIYGFEGDTYYQQWDCLRVYPTSEDDINKVVDVISVMLETYENLDGDTRKARGRADVINIRPDNMVNQINPVYSQSNNQNISNILDKKFEDSTHPLQYWWSLTKVPNSDIDTWTGVNLTNVYELDGDKGPLNKIKRWNNQLYAFQDKAIAMINFNNQTTIATQEGLPVEIQNSGKVSGHYYITTNNGCKNKWSIVESPNGLYFIDSYNKSINLIGDGIRSLSQLNLFQDWIERKERGNIWNPTRNVQAFKGFYDPIHKEVYFADGEDCICYNELLQQFTSFYDYQDMNHMFMIDNHIYSLSKDNKLYLMFEGEDYCNLYDKQCDYYMQYKINNEPFIDKTWTNLEYRADIFDRGNIQTNEFDTNDIVNNETFDLLKVWNEYQNGELDLTKVRFGYLKDAKPKFRIWRTNLPRAKATQDNNKFGLDRIRNPWIMLELRKSKNTNKRMEFHDLIIKYVI